MSKNIRTLVGVACPAGFGGSKLRIPVIYTAKHCLATPPLQLGTLDITRA